MRVGNDYQAFVPNMNTVQRKPAPDNHFENAILIWSPKNNIPEEKCKLNNVSLQANLMTNLSILSLKRTQHTLLDTNQSG